MKYIRILLLAHYAVSVQCWAVCICWTYALKPIHCLKLWSIWPWRLLPYLLFSLLSSRLSLAACDRYVCSAHCRNGWLLFRAPVVHWSWSVVHWMCSYASSVCISKLRIDPNSIFSFFFFKFYLIISCSAPKAQSALKSVCLSVVMQVVAGEWSQIQKEKYHDLNEPLTQKKWPLALK